MYSDDESPEMRASLSSCSSFLGTTTATTRDGEENTTTSRDSSSSLEGKQPTTTRKKRFASVMIDDTPPPIQPPKPKDLILSSRRDPTPPLPIPTTTNDEFDDLDNGDFMITEQEPEPEIEEEEEPEPEPVVRRPIVIPQVFQKRPSFRRQNTGEDEKKNAIIQRVRHERTALEVAFKKACQSGLVKEPTVPEGSEYLKDLYNVGSLLTISEIYGKHEIRLFGEAATYFGCKQTSPLFTSMFDSNDEFRKVLYLRRGFFEMFKGWLSFRQVMNLAKSGASAILTGKDPIFSSIDSFLRSSSLQKREDDHKKLTRPFEYGSVKINYQKHCSETAESILYKVIDDKPEESTSLLYGKKKQNVCISYINANIPVCVRNGHTVGFLNGFLEFGSIMRLLEPKFGRREVQPTDTILSFLPHEEFDSYQDGKGGSLSRLIETQFNTNILEDILGKTTFENMYAMFASLHEDCKRTKRQFAEDRMGFYKDIYPDYIPNKTIGSMLSLLDGKHDGNSPMHHSPGAGFTSVFEMPSLKTPNFDSIFIKQLPNMTEHQRNNILVMVFVMIGKMFFGNNAENWQRALFLGGVPQSGKSTILSLLKEMFTPEHTAAISSSAQATFTMGSIASKDIVLLDECKDTINSTGKGDGISEDHALSVISGSTIDTVKKNKDAEFKKIKGSFVFATNYEYLAALDDQDLWGISEGRWARRVIIYKFPISCSDVKDSDLENRIKHQELGRIIAKSILCYGGALYYLQKTPKIPPYTIDDLSSVYYTKTREDFSINMSPFYRFMKSPWIAYEEGEQVTLTELMSHYTKYSGNKKTPGRSVPSGNKNIPEFVSLVVPIFHRLREETPDLTLCIRKNTKGVAIVYGITIDVPEQIHQQRH